jgi:transposase
VEVLRVEQVYVIRHKRVVEGVAVRQIAREMGISRNTVRKYLGQAERMRQVRPHKRRPVFEQVGPHPWTLPAARMGCCNTPGRPGMESWFAEP